MRQIDTTYRTLPAASGASARYSSRQSARPEVPTQFIDERDHLASQRLRRRPSPLEVLRTYDAGGKLRILRVPPGYRTDILA